ncbi:Putative dipeptidase CPSG_01350 [Durusdinium trenchii]
MVARHFAKRKSLYPFMAKPATVFDFGLSPDDEQRAAELHKTIQVYDGLIECTWYPGIVENILAGGPQVGGSLSLGNAGLERFLGEKEHMDAVPEKFWTYETLVRDLAYIRAACHESAGKVHFCTSAAELEAAYSVGAVALSADVQNSNFIGSDFDRLETVYWLGLRRIQLTYNDANSAGFGCMEESDGGLTKWGERLVGAMNDLGMIVDTGHCKPQTVIDAAKASRKPMTCSHAGLVSICPGNPRTQTEEAIKEVAKTGGVFGLVAAPMAVNNSDCCTVDDLVNNIDAAVKVIGEDHVGFGSDFLIAASMEEVLRAPEWDAERAGAVNTSGLVWPFSDGHVGFENNSGYRNLTRGLVAKGYSDESIRKIMGGNFLRVFKDVVG